MGDYVFTHPAGKKVNIHTLRWTFERYLERAGIADFRFHDLRHTFASRLAQAGVDPYTIQKLMGHKSFSTTQRYAHHYTESFGEGISALDCVRLFFDSFTAFQNPALSNISHLRSFSPSARKCSANKMLYPS